jgi:hypothetical protein
MNEGTYTIAITGSMTSGVALTTAATLLSMLIEIMRYKTIGSRPRIKQNVQERYNWIKIMVYLTIICFQE